MEFLGWIQLLFEYGLPISLQLKAISISINPFIYPRKPSRLTIPLTPAEISMLEKDLKDISCKTQNLKAEVKEKLNQKANTVHSIMTHKRDFSEQQRQLLENERRKNEGMDYIEQKRTQIGKTDFLIGLYPYSLYKNTESKFLK